eukprot:SAG11_NODE_80_length_17731_cov_13.985254_10_plen_177_part_00
MSFQAYSDNEGVRLTGALNTPFRLQQLEHFPKIHLAVSHETKLNRERMFSCPIGHRWAKRQEVCQSLIHPPAVSRRSASYRTVPTFLGATTSQSAEVLAQVEKMFYDPRPTCFNVPGKGDAVVAEDDASCKPKSDQVGTATPTTALSVLLLDSTFLCASSVCQVLEWFGLHAHERV